MIDDTTLFSYSQNGELGESLEIGQGVLELACDVSIPVPVEFSTLGTC